MSATVPLSVSSASRSRSGAALLGILRAPFALRTWAEVCYAVVTLPLAVAGFLFSVASLFLGVGLSITFVGLPLLAVTGFGARYLGSVQRGLARALLGERVPAPRRFESGPGPFAGCSPHSATPPTGEPGHTC